MYRLSRARNGLRKEVHKRSTARETVDAWLFRLGAAGGVSALVLDEIHEAQPARTHVRS